MGKTIIQTIGPLYGEVVNGTVFGRPNGSIYVPPTNKVVLNVPTGNKTTVVDGYVTMTPASISIVAESQDLSSNIFVALFSDQNCTQQVGAGRSFSAGSFNVVAGRIGSASGATIDMGESYYLRAQLLNNGDPVATSEIIEVVGA